MSQASEDLIVRNLIEALKQLRTDLDRMELWATTLTQFDQPVPEYRPSDRYVLKAATDSSRKQRVDQ